MILSYGAGGLGFKSWTKHYFFPIFLTFQMSGTGYVAVGHLLKLPGVRYHKASLHTLVSAFEENDNDIIQPRGILSFYKFCEGAIVSFESSIEFLRDVLKRHDAEELPFQLKVEKTVWNIIRDQYLSHETHQEFCNNDEIEEDICFLLFCEGLWSLNSAPPTTA